jgi:hypothetical protein
MHVLENNEVNGFFFFFFFFFNAQNGLIWRTKQKVPVDKQLAKYSTERISSSEHRKLGLINDSHIDLFFLKIL